MSLDLPLRALLRYALTDVRLTELSGGTINRVWRVDSSSGVHVLKEYRPDYPEASRLDLIINVQRAARDHGLPVPAVAGNKLGDSVTRLNGHDYVLSEYVEGRLHEPGRIPATAARNMGVLLGRLHDAMLSLPRDPDPEAFPSVDGIKAELRSLLRHAKVRRDNPVDAVAEGVLEAKLELLSTVDAVPDLRRQWTHGDYEWRNVLFDEQDEVVAVFDFDNTSYYPPERDVMRCVALSFPTLEPEADDFFEGYAAARHVSPRDVASYVDLYRYLTTFRVWPISERYLRPDRYQPRWDALIQPFAAWDWHALTDRFIDAAERAAKTAPGLRGRR
jgi:Ser/Thr protein kinase RdoA (MazF antagonist)